MSNRELSQYVLEVPRGFSVHVFKNPPPPQSSGFSSSGKPDYIQNRDVASSNWVKQPSYPPRPESERKPLSHPVETRTTQLSAYARVFEPKRSSSKPQRPYGIYPTAIPDTYIYERSVSSASDVLSSDSSSTSSDSDLNAESLVEFALEVSSTRASSSTETLETTALDAQTRFSTSPPSNAPLRSSSPSTTPQTPAGTRVTRSTSQSPTSPTYPTGSSRRVSAEEAFDSDSETVISDGVEGVGYGSSQAQASSSAGTSRGLGASLPLSTPIRRGSDEGSPRSSRPNSIPPRDASYPSNVPQSSHRQPGSLSPPYDEALLRAPPGLQASTSSARPAPSRSSSGNSSKSPSSPDAMRDPASDATCVLVAGTKRCVRWTENLGIPTT